jgi:monoamine oxidase
MAASLKSPVRQGHEVVAIENSADGVTVEVVTGAASARPRQSARYAAKVRKIAVSPTLPGRAAEAIAQISWRRHQRGPAVKERFWELMACRRTSGPDLPIQRSSIRSPAGEALTSGCSPGRRT